MSFENRDRRYLEEELCVSVSVSKHRRVFRLLLFSSINVSCSCCWWREEEDWHDSEEKKTDTSLTLSLWRRWWSRLAHTTSPFWRISEQYIIHSVMRPYSNVLRKGYTKKNIKNEKIWNKSNFKKRSPAVLVLFIHYYSYLIFWIGFCLIYFHFNC